MRGDRKSVAVAIAPFGKLKDAAKHLEIAYPTFPNTITFDMKALSVWR